MPKPRSKAVITLLRPRRLGRTARRARVGRRRGVLGLDPVPRKPRQQPRRVRRGRQALRNHDAGLCVLRVVAQHLQHLRAKAPVAVRVAHHNGPELPDPGRWRVERAHETDAHNLIVVGADDDVVVQVDIPHRERDVEMALHKEADGIAPAPAQPRRGHHVHQEHGWFAVVLVCAGLYMPGVGSGRCTV